MNDFFKAIRSYLTEYLPKQKCCSEHTVRAYKLALNLFVSYLRKVKGLSVKKINFDSINRDVVLGFLDWIETVRGCSASTRNHRLMVLRSFLSYAGVIDCTHVFVGIDVASVPIKKTKEAVVPYLSETALQAFLKQPNITKRKELRDLFFMVLMYDTAARCNELLVMTIKDLRLKINNPISYLHGKSRTPVRSISLLSPIAIVHGL